MKLEKRASFGWPATAADRAPCANGLVVHYDGDDQGLAGTPHSACRDYWRRTRVFHMGPSRGWLDIGYSFAVCPHGYVLEGRGWQRQQAAQPGGNSTWTSCTFMSGPSEKPTAAQVAAFGELRSWLRGKGLAAAVSYHSRFVSTSCPGAILRGMATAGSLISTPTQQEGDMPEPKELWNWDGIPAPPWIAEEGNTSWTPSSYLHWGYRNQAKLTEKVDELTGKVDALTGELAEIKALLTVQPPPGGEPSTA